MPLWQESNMEVVPLHKCQELTAACMDILNAYWPRSQAARNHGLSKSCDQLPVCLALIQRDISTTEVLGFSKLSAVQGIPSACLVESVIVREVDRGKGLGKVLMNLTEEYAQRLDMKTVYLNTLDKEGFYARIGYVRCKPVISLGDNAHRVPEALLKKLMTNTDSPPGICDYSESKVSQLANKTSDIQGHVNVTSHQATDSTTPVAAEHRRDITVGPSSCEGKSQQPVSIVAPPPAPPLPPTIDCLQTTLPYGSYSRAVVRMNPNYVIWMKKEI